MNSCLQRATRTDSGSAVDAAGIEDLPAQALSAQGALESRTRRRYRAIHTLLEQGWALAEIARELHLNHKTVQTFARATRVEDLLGHIAGHRPSKLDAQRDYLLRRWAEGCHPPTALHRELADRGLHCNVRPITRYLRTVQVNGNLPAPGPTPPKTRRLVGWIMRHPTSLEPGEQELLAAALAACPELDALHRRVQAFAELMAKREGRHLHTWVEQVRADDLPSLGSFASGLEKDWDAVTAGLTLTWSSGAVEGTVNKIKLLSTRPTDAPASPSFESGPCSPEISDALSPHHVDGDHGVGGQYSAQVHDGVDAGLGAARMPIRAPLNTRVPVARSTSSSTVHPAG